MNLDQRITHAAARVAVAWANMDDDQAQEWQAEVDRLMDFRDALDSPRPPRPQLHPRAHREAATIELLSDQPATFDVLKGSPDHSGRLGDSIARLERRGY